MNKKVVNRLKRLEGQITHVRTALEGGADCKDVTNQLLAIKGALDSALLDYVKTTLSECARGKNKEEPVTLLQTIIKKL